MKSKLQKQLHSLDVRKIILLDGRELTINFGKPLKLTTHDQLTCRLHFDIFNQNNELHRALANIIANLLTTHSISYAATTTRAVREWLSIENTKTFTTLSTPAINSLIKVNVNYYPFIPPLLRRLAQNYPHLINDDFIDFLNNGERWEERNPAYFRLIANDPERGSLTIQELESIHSELNSAFSSNKISLRNYTLCWFSIATGIRPVQLSRLKNSDIQIIGNEVMLKIPLAKAEGIIDQGFYLRKAPTILADCIIKFRSQTRSISSDERVFQINPLEVSKKIIEIFDSLNTYSARLETQIPVNAYRFRYTLATRAIAQGASDHEVARLLTHRSTSCVKFYRASLAELQRPIQEALHEEMSFFANAFKGKLITSLEDASIKNSAIADFFRLAGKTIGSCGTHAKCLQNAPIACLTCPYFEPLVQAPWQELLNFLLDDQAQEKTARIKEITNQSIQAINEIMIRISIKEESLQ